MEREAHEQGMPHPGVFLSRWHHNQVGLCVAWALTYLRGSTGVRDASEEDRRSAFDLARRYWVIKNVLGEVRQGARRFSSSGRKITITFAGDVRLDAIDRLLDFVDDVISMPQGPPVGSERLRAWIAASGHRVPWDGVPLLWRQEYREYAAQAISSSRFDLPDDIDLGGFSVAEARRVLNELLARAWHANACVRWGSINPSVVLPIRARETLIQQLTAATHLPRERVDAIVGLLTADLEACGDPCLTPVVPVAEGRIVEMSSLIVPGAPLRNLVERVQADPSRAGAVGRRLGLVGSQTVAATLRQRLVRAKVAERIKVYDAGGRQLGDLDVVAFDEEAGELAVLEVLWEIGPDGSGQVARTESKANAKRDQVRRFRSALASGARVRWPPGWSVPATARIAWFILTPNVLPVTPLDADGILVRSHQMLARFRWGDSTVRGMVDALVDPPDPPTGLGGTEWHSLHYGPYDVRVEFVVG